MTIMRPDRTDTAHAPGGATDWCRIVASALPGPQAEADVYIFDEIGYWGTTARDFAEQITGLDVALIRLHLNSPGGDAWDGVAIANVLRRHRARVEVIVEGVAASAASMIAMAGDHITMAASSMLMIHDASGMAVGDAATMRDAADLLDKLSDSYADAYAKRAGGTREQWRDTMRIETWYEAEEAVLAGLADEWDETIPAVAHSAARFLRATAPTVGDIEDGQPAVSPSIPAGLLALLGTL